VDLSSDGSVLIIGSSINCFFHTVRYDSAANDWLPFGQGITCANQADAEAFGEVTLAHVALSDDGLVAAIGKPSTPGDFSGDFSVDSVQGTVAIYQYRGSWEMGSWQPLGQTLTGADYDDAFGASLSFSGDGMVIAVGAPRSNGGRGLISGIDVEVEPNIGACFVYRYDELSQEWQQLGSAILGENVGDLFGTSVSLNGNCAAVAVGAPYNNDNGDNSGHVRVLEFHAQEAEWVRVGQDIPGVLSEALSGSGVALSETGDTVVVGSPNNNPNSNVISDQHGSVQVFETFILPKSGTVAVTVAILFPNDCVISWTLERLDVEQAGRLVYASVGVDKYDVYDCNATETLMLDEGGVYRFHIYSPDESDFGGYQVFLGNDTNDLGSLLVDELGNFTDYSEFSFLAPPPSANPPIGTTTRLLTLSITFDDHPQDVHWVLVSTVFVLIDGSLRADRRSVVAFGPERQYGPALAGKTLEVLIDASAVSPASELKLIFTDTAGDGICCRVGNGSFLVSDQEGRLLFNGTSMGKRREVLPFSLET
jgi:FG-GAP repeat